MNFGLAITHLLLLFIYFFFFFTESLLIIDEATAPKLKILKHGQKLCMTCLKGTSGAEEHFMEQFNLGEVSFQSLNDTVHTLDCSPLKRVGSRDKVSCAKRKIHRVHSAKRAKCARALTVSVDSTETPEEDTEWCRG